MLEDVPFAVIELLDAVMVDVVVLAAPGTKDTTSVSVIVTPPTVPVIVDVPATVLEVNVAVYVPFPLSVTELNVPALAPRVTVAPHTVILLPFPSFN